MESRAKQRLTGAIILVALVVLLVPELLTGPRNSQPAADAPTDEGLRRYTIDLDAQNPGQPMAPASQEAPVALPEVAPPAAAPTERASPGEQAVPDSAPAAVAPTTANPVSTPTPSPAASAPVAPAPVASAPASMPSAAPVTAPRAERGTFVVQLGSFGSRDNADRLVREMNAKGFAAFIAPITSNGRELYRVRVGPTRDRASAEALASQLKRMGQSGSIVPIS
jgi:cell division septation protein DedD